MRTGIEQKTEYPVSGLPVDVISGLGEKLERAGQLSSAGEEKRTVFSIDILVNNIKRQLRSLNSLD
ncbi:MAG: hypothetical protein JW738_08000 [Actinobacteria bacterium]|nr:hypothetical protein [Actinomycetota bacterium]